MTSNLIKIYAGLDGSIEQTNNTVITRGSDSANQLQYITPFDTSYLMQCNFQLANGQVVASKTLLSNGTEDVDFGTADTWNIKSYDIPASVLSTLSKLVASPLYVSAEVKESNPLYYGGTYADETELPLIADDATLVDENYATVDNTNTSWEYDATANSWSDLGFLKTQYAVIKTIPTTELSVSPSIVSSSETITVSALQTLTEWLNDIETELDKLKTQTDGNFEPTNDDVWSSDKRTETYLASIYMKILNYDTGATGDTVDKALELNDGTNIASASDVKQVLDWTNQGVNTADTPTFAGAQLNGNLAVTGTTNLTGDVTLSANEVVGGNLTVYGNEAVGGDFSATGAIKENGVQVELTSNKVTAFATTPTDDEYPSAKLVDDRFDAVDVTLDGQEFPKTGFDIDVQALVSLSFVDATMTFTLAKTSATVPYYLSNVKYELDTDMTVTLPSSTEGKWFIYINASNVLEASQVAWNLRADTACPIAVVYWNATDSKAEYLAYEVHSWRMSGTDHYDSHFGLGTIHIRGGAVSDTGSDTLDVTAVTIADEDITITTVDNDTPTGYFEQPLTPLKSQKYYRTGVNGDLRGVDDSTIPVYLVSNVIQLNPYTAGSWTLTGMTNNKWGAMWVIYTNQINNPVKLILGQQEADTENDAKESNTITDLLVDVLAFEEIKVAYRVMVKQLSVAPYYEIGDIESVLVNPITGVPTVSIASHGGLAGLLDDDHPQYFNSARLTASTELDVRYYTETELDTKLDTKIDKDTSAYTAIAASAVADNDLARMPLDDNGSIKTMTLTEIYAGANTATGSFVASGDYGADGLTANEAVFVGLHSMTSNATNDYQVYIDVKAPASGQIIYMQLPTMTSTEPLEISTDNETTYIDMFVNDTGIPANSLSGKIIKAYYNGTNWIYDGGTAIPYEYTTGDVISSTKDVVELNDFGSPQIKEIACVSAEQIALDGDMSTTTNYVASGGTNTVANNVLSNTGSGTSSAPYLYQNTSTNVILTENYVMLGVVRVTNSYCSSIVIKYDGSTGGTNKTVQTITTPTTNTWYPILIKDTLPSDASGNFKYIIYQVYSTETDGSFRIGETYTIATLGTTDWNVVFGTTGVTYSTGDMAVVVANDTGDGTAFATYGKEMQIKNFRILPTNNTPYSSETATELSKRFPTYLPYGINDVDTFELKSVGVNLFGGDVELGTISATTGLDDLTSSNRWRITFDSLISVIGGETYIKQVDSSYSTFSYYWYDFDETFIEYNSTGIAPSNARFLRFGGKQVDDTTITNDELLEIKNSIMLNEGTTAEDYRPYNSVDTFSLPNGISVGTVQDKLRFDNDKWVYDKYNDEDTTVVKGTTGWTIADILTTTHIFEKDLTSLLGNYKPALNSVVANAFLKIGDTIFTVVSDNDLAVTDTENMFSINATTGAVRIRVNKTTYATSADFETYLQANDVTFRYELATPTLNTEIDQDGGIIQEKVVTMAQQGDIGQDITIDFNLNSIQNSKANTYKINMARKDIDELEDRVTTNETDISTNATNISSNDTDIATNVTAIALNTTHRSSDGSDHSQVVTNKTNADASKVITDFITVTQPVDLDTMESDVNTNNTKVTYPSADSTKVGYISVTQAVDLDTMESDIATNATDITTLEGNRVEFTSLMSTSTVVSTDTTKPTTNLTLSESIDNFDAIKIAVSPSSSSLPIFIELMLPADDDSKLLTYIYTIGATSSSKHIFRVYRDSSTTLTAYYATAETITYGSPANITIATYSTMYIDEIIGIKY